MKTRATTLLVIYLLSVGCSSGQRPVAPQPPRPAPVTPLQPALHELKAGTATLKVEAALNNAQRLKGLSGRKELPPDQGMLFVYRTNDLRRFWMKDCIMALDIAWLAEDGTILSIDTLEAPLPGAKEDDLKRSASPSPSRFVLEMRAGWFKDHALLAGAKIQIPAALASAATE